MYSGGSYGIVVLLNNYQESLYKMRSDGKKLIHDTWDYTGCTLITQVIEIITASWMD